MRLHISDEDYIKKWLDVQYEGKKISEDIPVYKTNNGEFVRSKSELQIANMLKKMNCPYRYEAPFVLSDGRVVYPDFTILDVARRREVYWEHRGMMDDKQYARNSVDRIKLLIKSGLHIGADLFITEETSSSPLGTDEIEEVINCIKSNLE